MTFYKDNKIININKYIENYFIKKKKQLENIPLKIIYGFNIKN